MNRYLALAVILALAGGGVASRAQQAQEEPVYNIQMKPSWGSTVGALLEDQKCSVKEFATGACAAWNAYASINEQVNKQNAAMQQSQRDYFEKAIRDKVAAEKAAPPAEDKKEP